MSNHNTEIASAAPPTLAPPGAGLPFTEWFVARYFVMPRKFKSTSAPESLRQFAAATDEIMALAQPLSIEQLGTKILIPRCRGIEDSSRNWSVAMTLNHLNIVCKQIKGLIILLSENKPIENPASIERVKPKEDVDCSTIVQQYKEVADAFVERFKNFDAGKYPATHPHPWFGEFNCHQWLVLAAVHQGIHKVQIVEIIRRL